MNKILKTNISPLNVPDWVPANAIRDLLQNALDDESTFEYSYSEGVLKLTSKGVKLNPSVWAVGVSGKRGDPNTVGEKGEGLVVATQVLLRDGFNIYFINSDEYWQPQVRYSEMFETDCIEIEITKIDYGNDYTVVIEGVSEELWEQVVDECLYLQLDDSLGSFTVAPCGSRIFFDKKGKLYVGGLYVCDTNLEYTYDLHPSKIKLNRDRKQIDSWDLQGVTAQILRSAVNAKEIDAKRVVDLAALGSNDTHHMRYYGAPSVGNVAYEKFKSSYGDKAVAAKDWSQRERMVKEGYEEVVVVNSAEYYKMIVDSNEYEEYINSIELEEKEPEDSRTPLEMLEDFIGEYDLFGLEVELQKVVDIFKRRGVSFDN